MFKTTSKTLLLAAALTLPFTLQATEATLTKTETAISPEATVAAHTLLKTMDMENTYKKMIQNVTDMQIKQSPQLEAMKPTMMAFFDKYMGWNALKDDMAAIYAKHYTAKELEELNAFYLTPVGQKTVKLMPTISAEGMQVGQAKVAAHMGELQELIMAEMTKQQEAAAAAAK